MERSRILIVEDEGVVAIDISNRLRMLGYEIAGIAPSAEGALQKATELHPDLVLMDIMLKGTGDGIEAAQRIRSDLNIPVVYLTAYSDEGTLERAKVTEPFGFIIKPFEDRDLQTTLAMALAKHRIERELRASELKYRTLFSKASDAILLMDGEVIVDCNEQALQMFKGTRDRLIGKSPRDLSPPCLPDGRSSWEGALEKIQAALAGVPQFFHWQPRRFDGTVFDAGVSLNVIEADGRRLLQAVARDITQQERWQRRLAQLKECFLGFGANPRDNIQRLTEHCGMMMEATYAHYIRLDRDSLRSWGQWQTPANFKLMDKPEGHLCYDVIRSEQDDVQVIRHLPETPFAQSDPNVLPLQLETYIGKAVVFQDRHVGTLCVSYRHDYAPSEEDLRIMHILASAVGVEEERLQAEEELRILRLGVDNSDEAIFITNPDGHIVQANPAFERIYGYSREETLGQTPRILKSGQIPAQVYKQFWDTLLAKQAVKGELINKTKDGRLITVEGTANPILDEEGQIIGFVGIQHDITKRKQTEEHLKTNERFLSSIFASIQDGISVLDTDLRIVRVNAKMQDWYAHALPLEGKKCYEAYHGSSKPCAVCPVRQTLETQKTVHEIVPLAGKDGATVGWLDLFSFPLLDDATGQIKGVIEYMRDISEKKRVEQVRDILYQIGEDVSTTENLDDLLRCIHDRIKTVMYAENCYIALYDSETELVSFPFFVDQFDPAPEARAKRKGFTEYVLHTGKPLLLTPELYEQLVNSGAVESIGTPPISWLGVPLFIEGTPYGALVVQSYQEGCVYSIRDQDLLAAIGRQAAMAIERKRKDDALRHSEEKYRLLIDNIQDGVFIVQDGVFQFANRAFADSIGYSIPELIGLDLQKIIAPEDWEWISDLYRRMMAREAAPAEFEARGLHHNGISRIIANVNLSLIQYRGRAAVMGTLKNITERKQVEQERELIQRINQLLLGELDAERALNRISAELLEIVPHETVALALIQKETDQIEYIVSGVEGGTSAAKSGHTNHYFEAYPGSLTQQILYDRRDPIQNDLKFGVTKFERHLGDLRMRSFLAVPLINAGVPLGMLFLASVRPHGFQSRQQQILNQVQPQLALYVQHHRLIEKMFDSEAKYRTLFENSNDIIYILQDRRFIYVNRKFEEILGYNLEEVNGADFNFMKLVAPESIPIIEDRARRLERGEKLSTHYEFKGLSKDGRSIDFEASVSYISFDGKTATQGILRDISERKRFEIRQQEMQMELVQRAKLSSIGMLSAGIAHNMNVPLQGIINHIELLKMTQADVPYLDDMLTQAQRIAAIINNMLFKSRQEQDQGLRDLDLNQLLVEELTFLNADLEFKHRVIKQYHFDPNLPKIKGVYSDFSQAILNIIRNALDAMYESREKHLAVRTEALPTKEILIEVGDTGCGIAPDHLDQIFSPFFSTKPVAGKQNGAEPAGTGLGLSSAYQLLKKYHARYDVQSRPGEGTTFRVYVPIIQQHPKEAKEAKETVEEAVLEHS